MCKTAGDMISKKSVAIIAVKDCSSKYWPGGADIQARHTFPIFISHFKIMQYFVLVKQVLVSLLPCSILLVQKWKFPNLVVL